MIKKISLIIGTILIIGLISFYIAKVQEVNGDDNVTMEYFNTTIKALEDKITILETKVNELESNTSTKLNEIETKIDTNLQTTNVAINNVKTSLEGKINTTSTTLNDTIVRLDNVDKESNAIMWFLSNNWDVLYINRKLQFLIHQEKAFQIPTKPF